MGVPFLNILFLVQLLLDIKFPPPSTCLSLYKHLLNYLNLNNHINFLIIVKPKTYNFTVDDNFINIILVDTFNISILLNV